MILLQITENQIYLFILIFVIISSIFQRGECAVDRTQNIEIHTLLAYEDTTKVNCTKPSASDLQTSEEQLTNINSCISYTAAEHSALVEQLELDSTSSDTDSDSCGDAKDASHCDPESIYKACNTGLTDALEPAVNLGDLLLIKSLENEVETDQVPVL